MCRGGDRVDVVAFLAPFAVFGGRTRPLQSESGLSGSITAHSRFVLPPRRCHVCPLLRVGPSLGRLDACFVRTACPSHPRLPCPLLSSPSCGAVFCPPSSLCCASEHRGVPEFCVSHQPARAAAAGYGGDCGARVCHPGLCGSPRCHAWFPARSRPSLGPTCRRVPPPPTPAITPSRHARPV